MHFRNVSRIRFLALGVLLLAGGHSYAQQSASTSVPQEPPLGDTVHRLELQIQQLQSAVQELKDEARNYRSEAQDLKQELRLTLAKLNSAENAQRPPAGLPAPATGQPAQPEAGDQSLEGRVAHLEENQEILNGRVDEQYQTKVESASKHRVRLSGLVLLNVFSNGGNVDHLEVPGVALPTNPAGTGANTGGAFAATVRQSQIGLEVYGPTFAGAKTRGDLVTDFFGEGPDMINGAAFGHLRLRTGTVRLDWPNTSVVGGTDILFISPVSPTSFASLGIPALSYSGNLWAWIPQVRVEHRWRVAENSAIQLSGGILDPLTGETPTNEFLRLPGAGESSRQPAYAGRVEWSRRAHGQPLAVGFGGYYSRENWGFDRTVDGWAATTDWSVPFGERFLLTGKLYAGQAIGGLGGGIGRSVVFNGPLIVPSTVVQAVPTVGGWAQFKFKPTAKLEFNAAGGQDNATASDLRGFTLTPNYYAANIARNRSEFINFIYRPRSNLLLSTEFRTLRTFYVDGSSERANQLNLMMGVFF
jgi:hypothetical protein